MDDCPFDQARDVAALTTRRVLEGAPILLVAHALDDHSWQFLDGMADDPDEGRVIVMGTALGMDASLRQIADLQPGWIAERSDPTGHWLRRLSVTEPARTWRERYGVTGRELVMWAVVLAGPVAVVAAVVYGMLFLGGGLTD